MNANDQPERALTRSGTPLTQSSRDAYEAALLAASREARATLAVSIVIFAFFWLMIALFGESQAAFWGMPLWFWLSCIGGYVLSVLGVIWLTRHVFVDVDFSVADALRAADAQQEEAR